MQQKILSTTTTIERILIRERPLETEGMRIQNTSITCENAAPFGYLDQPGEGELCEIQLDALDVSLSERAPRGKSHSSAESPETIVFRERGLDAPSWPIMRKREQVHGGWRSRFQTPFMEIYSSVKSHKVVMNGSAPEHTSIEKEAQFVLRPPAWFRAVEWSYGVQISAVFTSGWKYSLEPFRIVSENSLIFEFCRDGNLAGLRSLLKLGE